MRRFSFQIETDHEIKRRPSPWQSVLDQREREAKKRAALPPVVVRPARPAPFGKRRHEPATARRSSLSRLTSLFQGPRKTSRTKER